ncbi:MAG: hypothetical protein LBN33_05220, partial [Desulfovibrio sp.]|nr:hypothetical protein [Desulfovibrio sp.]
MINSAMLCATFLQHKSLGFRTYFSNLNQTALMMNIEYKVITHINRHSFIYFITLITGIALYIRLNLFHIESQDYIIFLSKWYDKITNEGFYAFSELFSDYTMPYLYLLYFMAKLKIPALYGIKIISVLAEFIIAVYAAKIV